MSLALVSAMALQCVFNQPADGSVPKDSLPSMRVPLPAAAEASLAAGKPPVTKVTYAGEGAPEPEWAFGRPITAETTEPMVLRVRMGDGHDPVLRYRARYGKVARADAGTFTFTEALNGACKLQPANGTPE